MSIRKIEVMRGRFFLPFFLSSLLIHATIFAVLHFFIRKEIPPAPQSITLKLHKELPKPPVVEVKEELPPPPPPPPKPEVVPKKEVLTERPKHEKPKEKPKPIQGISPEAVSATGIAVPLGNSLLLADDGKRHKADEVKSISSDDLSSDPHLISSSITIPKYTEEALEANLEGYFVVDVYVDATGKVTSAEIRKKVGFGMDPRILSVANSAKFLPRKDNTGKPIPGWTEIKFKLEIPN